MTSFLAATVRLFLAAFAIALLLATQTATTEAAESTAERHLLYVTAPGIRNDMQYGGAGILVFDIDKGHRFVKRIDTTASQIEKPENIKGVCASAATGRLFFTTPTRLYCLDLKTERDLWNQTLPGGCDRMALSPDGRRLYVPSFEGPHWNIVDADGGKIVGKVETNSGSHNTVCSRDGSRVYCAGLRSPLLTVIDTKTGEATKPVNPFSAAIRPFTVNADRSRCYCTVNGLLGFEVGDLNSGKVVGRVVVQDFKQGPTMRHGCPSHGIGLTPDEREIWVCDSFNKRLHIFEVASLASLPTTAPKQIATIELRDEPGWITFGIDGRYAYPSTGDVIDTATRNIVARLTDEKGQAVQSEKLLEIDFQGDKVSRCGDQFGVGRVTGAAGK